MRMRFMMTPVVATDDDSKGPACQNCVACG
jgi:hypothetical protein